MRHLSSRSLCGISLLVAACAGQTGTGGAGSFVQQVQSAAVAVCGFLPQAQSIGELAQANPTQMQQATVLAQAVCNAFRETPLPRTAPGTEVTLRVGNVPVEGTIVR